LVATARRKLTDIGVEVQLGAMVTDVDADGLEVKDTDGQVRRIPSATKIWAAGVQASGLGRVHGEQTGAAVDRSGRISVELDLTLPGHRPSCTGWSASSAGAAPSGSPPSSRCTAGWRWGSSGPSGRCPRPAG
jgi:hypothetical protein